jgi:hypothetical protein
MLCVDRMHPSEHRLAVRHLPVIAQNLQKDSARPEAADRDAHDLLGHGWESRTPRVTAADLRLRADTDHSWRNG